MRKKKFIKIIGIILVVLILILVGLYLIQRFWAHRTEVFKPDYAMLELTPESDYETIFLQTGLGTPAVDKLLKNGQFSVILEAQRLFFNQPEVSCEPLLGWFTREDHSKSPKGYFVDLEPGDIIVTTSTHSLGWRHGHAGLVLDKDTVLESTVWGEDSTVNDIDFWKRYSNYAVLRVKDASIEERRVAADYAYKYLLGVPYSFMAGFLGPKASDTDSKGFGVHCTYLVWYVWNHFGVNLDSDGGRLVSAYDLINSDKLEVVQLYGMDPKMFLD